MAKHTIDLCAALVFGLGLATGAAAQSTPSPAPWVIYEIYSSADGMVQFVEIGVNDCARALVGKPLLAYDLDDPDGYRYYTFETEAQANTCNVDRDVAILVGTQRFAELSVVKPDFVVPNGFFYLRNGSVYLDGAELRYQTLPTNGADALWSTGTHGVDDSRVRTALTANARGDSGVFALVTGANTIVEYFHQQSNDYFLTAYSTETMLLDAGVLPDWKRTSYTFPAWISLVTESGQPPPDLLPVCRIYLGNSHFYSISASECAAVARQPGFILETAAAFFATLPDPASGRCPPDQTGLYRLWNAHGTGHRYTTQPPVRDDMLARGYVAEGYGAENFAMCVGGGAPSQQ